MEEVCLTYDDVLLVPQFSDIESRSEIDLSSELDNFKKLNYPIISAPMDTVTGVPMAVEMSRLGGLGIIHRYNTPQEQSLMVLNAKKFENAGLVGAAIGVTGDYLQRAGMLIASGVDILCLDVAHGHHANMQAAISEIRNKYPDIHIMAGNVATAEAFNDLEDWGANSIKVGIGNGSICSTRIQTGHGVPSIASLAECYQNRVSAKIIADGGIRNSGDIVKALAAGADFIMLGSMLAGTKESPGEIINSPNGPRKTYRGMASREAQNEWRGKSSAPEGISVTIPYKGELEPLFNDIVNHVRSGLSYSGARNISELRDLAVFIRQTAAGQFESSTHITSKV